MLKDIFFVILHAFLPERLPVVLWVAGEGTVTV